MFIGLGWAGLWGWAWLGLGLGLGLGAGAGAGAGLAGEPDFLETDLRLGFVTGTWFGVGWT